MIPLEEKNKSALIHPDTPLGFHPMRAGFLEWLRVRNYSEHTIYRYQKSLGYFFRWAQERGMTRIDEVTRPVLERYQRWLFHYRTDQDKPLAFKTQHAHLLAIKIFYRWLVREHYLEANPASELELPKLEQRLPREILTLSEVETILNQPNLSDPLGIRDRAILEMLYSCGMRRSELANITLYDLDFDRGTVMIRQGKGKKDRLIPVGERAIAWVQKYITEVRPAFVIEPDTKRLFLGQMGEPIGADHFSKIVRNHVAGAAVGKQGSCHLFRHTMATLMLENGADIRFIQEMLGHARLTSTQIYTQVSIKKLKEIHTATHPSARLRPPREKENG